MSSPEPMVSDAMTAPGPKIVNHASGLRDCSANGSGSTLLPRSASRSGLIMATCAQMSRRSSPAYGRLQRPSLQARNLQNLRRAETFLVNDPTAEQVGRVFRDAAGRQQFQILSQSRASLQRKLVVRAVVIICGGMRHEKVGRRHSVRADKYTRRYPLSS